MILPWKFTVFCWQFKEKILNQILKNHSRWMKRSCILWSFSRGVWYCPIDFYSASGLFVLQKNCYGWMNIWPQVSVQPPYYAYGPGTVCNIEGSNVIKYCLTYSYVPLIHLSDSVVSRGSPLLILGNSPCCIAVIWSNES